MKPRLLKKILAAFAISFRGLKWAGPLIFLFY